MSHIEEIARKIIQAMLPWYQSREVGGIKVGDMRAKSSKARTEQQIVWDHAILAAAEFVRRLDNYDESRAILIHELLSTKLPQRAESEEAK